MPRGKGEFDLQSAKVLCARYFGIPQSMDKNTAGVHDLVLRKLSFDMHSIVLLTLWI